MFSFFVLVLAGPQNEGPAFFLAALQSAGSFWQAWW
jgi:hypothetical protein